jgi:hypothetical protein
MAIVTQAAFTTLRNLKYGDDQPGGGNSGEPYITQPIPPAFDQQVASTNIWNSDNGLIRGGFEGATRASALDFRRIGKFLKDPPRGPLFITKQVGLQLSNPQQETKQGPAGFLSRIANAVGPTRIYNLGINTLAQVPVNAFGGHFVRHGLTPVMSNDQKYASVVVSNDAFDTNGANNRLVRLKNKLQTRPNSNIAQYVSGPDSIDGIGVTTIQRYYNTLSNPQFNQYGLRTFDTANGPVSIPITDLTTFFNRPAPNIDYYLAQGVSQEYFNGNQGLIAANNNIITGSFNSAPSQIDQNVINYSAAGRTYNTLRSAIDTQITGSRLGEARIAKNDEGQVINPITFNYTGKSKYKNLSLAQYNLDRRIGISGANSSDQINLTPLYLSEAPPGTRVVINGREYNVRDLIKFRIEAVDNDNPNQSAWMIFRAYLKDINDNPNPTWNSVKYVGRGDTFYIYNGFERNVSFNFQVAAMSEAELEPMWQKLNYLYSNTMPDYSDNVLRAPYMKLTIGNYLYRQPGIIKSLTYTIDNNSPWEIAINDPETPGGSPLYELPHVLNVSMTFAPIHDFLPRKFPTKFGGGAEWENLPAFNVDRIENQNAWLTNIYNNSKTQLPTVGSTRDVNVEALPTITRGITPL